MSVSTYVFRELTRTDNPKQTLEQQNKELKLQILRLQQQVETLQKQLREKDVLKLNKQLPIKNKERKKTLTEYEYVSNGIRFTYFVGYEIASLLGYKRNICSYQK